MKYHTTIALTALIALATEVCCITHKHTHTSLSGDSPGEQAYTVLSGPTHLAGEQSPCMQRT